ncbi:MAG: leukotoxin LktA family filamentous adhesin [Methyloversatilis sp.]|uniref:leukotoxin LktA family filamentous adhesin n=1 Tax=Methyloversatilis sp. TaxID=2569862 RepID=UPI0027366911|nr:leukotoxin LktA family filamentous adhesin [Methyloversatilis sp.]MDP3871258.1 leukotoxin LktA family filamentous adhesin [Methyloversatilis sp.]
MKSTQRRRNLPRLRTLVANLHRPHGFAIGMASLPLLMSPAAWAQAIQADGRTLTTVSTAGAVTDIRTGTIAGNSGFNSFNTFSVNSGHTANLHVPSGAVNLVNIVRDARSDIHGTLNAIRDGRIGGNVFFANPHGFVVGAGGVVNVGSLSVSTPTQGFADRFFVNGQPDAGAVGQLLNGTAPLSRAAIRIDGRINAVDGVTLAAGTVSVAGAVLTGARFEGRAPDFTDIVNTQGVSTGSRLVERAGRIYIAADEDIEIAGTLDARGGAGIDGGEVELKAGRDILIDIDAMVTAAGDGDHSDGGRIDSMAQRNATLRSGAVMDASAGASGDGGFVEFSAKKTVSISGGALRAGAGAGGQAGHILIDPEELLWTGSGFDMYSQGALLELRADDRIVLDDVFLSSRKVDGAASRANHLGGDSTGASGKISLVSKQIELKNGTQLLANADNGFAAGDVELLATDINAVGAVRSADAGIKVQGSTIRGATITLSSVADTSLITQLLDTVPNITVEQAQTYLDSEMDDISDGPGGEYLAITTDATALTEIKGSLISGTGDVTIKAHAGARAGFEKIATADVIIGDDNGVASTISGRKVDVAATSDTSLTFNVLGNALRLADQSWLPAEDSGEVQLLNDQLFDFSSIPLVSLSESTARVTVDGATELTATDTLTLSSSATSAAKPTFAGLVVFSVAWGESTAIAETRVQGTTKLVSGNATSVKAVTDTELNVTASVNSTNKPIDATFVRASNNATTSAIVGDDTTTTAGSVAVEANTKADISAGAIASNTGGSGLGISVAVTTSTTNTTATLGGDVTTTHGDVKVDAKTDIAKNSSAAEAATLGNPNTLSAKMTNFTAGIQRNVGSSILGATGLVSSGTASKITDFMFPGIKEGKFNAAGAVSYTDSENNASASIAAGASVKAQGKVDVVSLINDRPSASADAKATSTGTAIGGSVVIANFLNNSDAWIGDLAEVDARGAIRVDAQTHIPYPWQIDWSSPAVILNHLQGNLLDLVLTTFALNSASGKSGLGLAAAVTVFTLENNSNAWVGEGAKLNTIYDNAVDPALDLAAQSVTVYAKNDVNTVNAVGILSKKFLGNSGGKAAIGGSANVLDISGEAVAGIRDGADVRAEQDVEVKAESNNQMVTVTEAGGSSDQVGIEGALSMNTVRTDTIAYIDDKATVDAGKNLTLDADSEIRTISVAGGIVVTKGPVGIGLSVSLNTLDADVRAFIGNRDPLLDLTPATGLIKVGDNLTLAATADTEISAYSLAGAVATSSKSQTDVPAGAGETQDGSSSAAVAGSGSSSGGSAGSGSSGGSAGSGTGKGKFGIAVSGDASVNDIEADTLAYISSGVQVQQADNVSVTADNTLDINALSGAVTISTQQDGNSIAGSYAQNTLAGTTSAYIADASVTQNGTLTLDADVDGNIKTLSASLAGAKGKAGVAGSVSVNEISNTTHAYIARSSLSGVSTAFIGASDLSGIQSVAGAIAFGGKAGIGLSFAWNKLDNDTLVYVDDSDLQAGGSITLDAQTDNDIDTISASLGLSKGPLAGSGAVAVNTITNTTEARIRGKKTALGMDAASGIAVLAKDDSEIFALAGAIGATSGNAGIGASVAWSEVGNSVKATIEGGADVRTTNGELKVDAAADTRIDATAVAGGVADKVAVSGSFSSVETDNTVSASIVGSKAQADNNAVIVTARDTSGMLSIAGSAALSLGGAAVGVGVAYNVIDNTTEALVTNSDVDGTSIRLEATENAEIEAIAAGGGGSAKVAVTGSLGINTISNSTVAHASGSDLDASGDITIKARDESEILSISGAASGAGTAAVGAAGSYNSIGGEVRAELSGGSADGANVRVDAERQGTLDVWAIAGSAAGTAGFAGSIALNNAGGGTTARIDDGAIVNATESATVTAEADDFIKSRAGSVAFGGSIGAAGGIAFNDIQSTTTAEVSGANTSVTALGGGSGEGVDNGALSAYDSSKLPSQQPLSGRQQKDTVKGVSVVASSTAMVENIALSAAGGGNAGVAATVGIAMMGGSTTAQVTGGAKLNASLGTSDQEVRVAAYHHDQIGSATGGAAIGGDAGIGGAADTAVVSHVTTAKVDNATLQANKAVTVDAGSTSKFEQVILAVGGGTYAGLAGTIGVLLVDGTTQALVNSSDLESQGSIKIEATSDTEVDIDAGALAVSGVAGVGITAAVTVVEQATLARVSGTSRLDADGATTIRADSGFDQEVLAATAAAAGGVGVAGTINVVLAKGTTDAQVGTGVQINSDTAFGGTDAQDVFIEADDLIKVESGVGSLGVGIGGAGVGAAVDVVLVRSGSSATVATGAQITADGDISVTADSVRDIDSTTAAAAGGLSAGIAGAVSVISIGTRPDGDASDNTTGSVSKATELASRSATGNQIDSDTDAADASAARANAARAGINASSDFNATPSNTSAAAIVASGATLNAGGNIDVLAHTRSDTDATAIGAAVSGGVSLGGGIAISMVEDRTVASLAGSTTASGDVTVRATDDQPDVSKLRTYAGGAGLAGLAASFAWHEKSSTATASLGGIVTASTGSVTVNAKVDHNLDAEGGAAALGVVGIGAAIAYVDETSSAEAQLLNGADITAESLDVYGQSRTTSKGEVVAAAGGIVAGAGADANVSDVSAARATVGNNVKVTTVGGLTQIRADSDPVAEAVTVGIAVSAGLSIGVSLAEATVDTDSLVTIGTGFDVTAGNLTLKAQTLPRAGRETASADALAAGGGLLLGATATEAIATVESITRVQMGAGHDIKLGNGVFNTLSKSTVSGLSDVSGIAIGFIAAGGNSAETTVDSTTEALIGAGTINAGSIVIRSESSDELDAGSTSGAGGLGVLLAASVVNDADATTTTQVAGTLRAATVDIDAKHTTDFQGTADSTSASVAGYSGAWVTNTVDNTTKVELLNGTRIENAQTVDIDAETRVIKGSAGADWTVQAASGGILSGASGASYSTIRNDTDVLIGSNAFIDARVAGLNAGAIRLGAKNDVDVYDAVLLDTGGAIAIAHTESFINADRNDADITVGAGTLLQSDGDIVLDARTEAIIDTEAQSKTYGLAGAPSGESLSRLITSNDIHLNGARLESEENIRLLAGHNNNLVADAETRLWNKTVIPINSVPDAHGEIRQDNRISIAAYNADLTGITGIREQQIARAAVASVKDIDLKAGEGSHTTRGYGSGTDLYREALEALGKIFDDDISLDIKGGSQFTDSRSGVNVNGTVFAGTRHHQYLEFAANGSVLRQSENMSFSRRNNVSLQREIQSRIDALQLLYNEYINDNPDVANGFLNDIQILQARQTQLGVGATVNFVDIDPAAAYTGNISITGDWLTGASAAELIAPGDSIIEVINNGNQFVRIKPGVAALDCMAALCIPGEAGGLVTLNGVRVSSTAEINARNQYGQVASFAAGNVVDRTNSPDPKILLKNTYEDPVTLNALKPEIHVDGDLSNARGIVKIESTGSVLVASNVVAQTIDIATKGDFIKTFSLGFSHLAGDPSLYDVVAGYINSAGNFVNGYQQQYEAIAKSEFGVATSAFSTSPWYNNYKAYSVANAGLTAEGSTIAGNNVFISGEKLNINGLIQSGLTDYNLTINSTVLNQAKAANGGWVALELPSAGSTLADVFRPKVRWDAASNTLELGSIQVEGGYMQFYGDIFSTGNGQLKVRDGYGRIEVSNTSGANLALNRLDTGSAAAGTIKIIDTSTKFNGKPLETVITRLNGQVTYTQTNASSDGLRPTVTVLGDASGRLATYKPRGERRFKWINAETYDVYKWETYSKSLLFDAAFLDALSKDPGGRSGGDTTTTRTERISGDWLAQDNRTADYIMDFTKTRTGVATKGVDSLWIVDSYGSDCAGDLCVSKTYVSRKEWEWTERNYYVHSLNASKAINIQFIGHDTGLLNVSSNGALALQGAVRNLTGNTSLSGSSIVAGDVAKIIAGNLTMTASNGSIGGPALAGSNHIKLDLQGTGALTASATGGVALWETKGDMRLVNVTGGNGSLVDLKADANLVDANGAANNVVGGFVRLTSENAGIGSLADPLEIDVRSPNGWIETSAAADTGLTETDGDMRLLSISANGGDVRLESVNGSILDVNEAQQVDVETRAQLLQVAQRARLTASAGANQSVDNTLKAYNDQKEQDYLQYWQMRGLKENFDANGASTGFTAAAYDAGYTFVLDAQTAQALRTANGWGDAEIAAYQNQRTAFFHQAAAEFGTGSASTFNKDFSYNVAVQDTTRADALRDGGAWTEAEVTNRIAAGLFKDTSDTEVLIEEANVIGDNIQLIAAHGIGKESAALVIGTNPTAWTEDQQLALIAAERADVRIDTDAKTITILRKDDVDFTAQNNGTITATATDSIYLGSEEDVRVASIATPADVRLKTAGALLSAATTGQAAVQSRNVTLEAGSGDLGQDTLALIVQVANNATVTARAGGDLFLSSLVGDLRIDQIYTPGLARIRSAGALVEVSSDLQRDIQARYLSLYAGTTIGGTGSSELDALDLGASPDGWVELEAADGIHVRAVDGALDVRSALSSAGDVTLRSPGNLNIGVIDAGGKLMLDAAGDVVQSAQTVAAVGNIDLSAARYIMADGATLRARDGRIDIATTGDVVVGRIEATNNATAQALRIVAGGGIHDGGDIGTYDLVAATPGAGVVLEATDGIGSATWNNGIPLPVADALETDIAMIDAMSTAGGLQIDEKDDVALGTVETDGDLAVKAGGTISGNSAYTARGNLDLLSGNSVTVLEATAEAGNATVIAEQDIIMDAVTAGQGVKLQAINGRVSVKRLTGDTLDISGKGDIDLGTLSVKSKMSFSTESITARVIHTGTSGPLLMNVTGPQGGMARWVDLTFDSPIGTRFERLYSQDARIETERGWLEVLDGRIDNQARFINPQSNVYMDNATTVIQPADIQLNAPDRQFALRLERYRLVTEETALTRSPLHEVVNETDPDNSGREESRNAIEGRVPNPTRPQAVNVVPALSQIAINIPLDIPAVNSGEEETEEEAEARRKAEDEAQNAPGETPKETAP